MSDEQMSDEQRSEFPALNTALVVFKAISPEGRRISLTTPGPIPSVQSVSPKDAISRNLGNKVLLLYEDLNYLR